MANKFKNENVDMLINKFIDDFKLSFSEINIRGKSEMLKYVYCFFRRWYFSSVIFNLELTPFNILSEYLKGSLPVVKNKYLKTVSKTVYSIEENTIDNPLILRDIKTIYNSALNGIKCGENYYFDEEFIEENKNLFCILDNEYIDYVIRIMLNLGLLKNMPSIGVEILCQGDCSLLKLNNRELFKKVIDEAVALACDNLNFYCTFEEEITPKNITDWIRAFKNTDTIFNMYFSTPALDNLDLELDEDNISEELAFRLYETGVAYDKWFLTPFSAYLGLINIVYTTEYNMYGDMCVFMDIVNENKKFYFNHNPAQTLYAPCTYFYPTDIARYYFDVESEDLKLDIFNSYSRDKLVNIISSQNLSDYADDIIFNYYPPFDIYSLRVSLVNDRSVWFDIDVSELSNLNDISRLITICVFKTNADIENYVFYTLPRSPFNEYKYPVIDSRKSNVYNKRLNEIFDNKNSFYYSFGATFLDTYVEMDFVIELKKAESNTVGKVIPELINSSRNFDRILGF
ncbi:MAG: hypothetical protein ACI4VF_07135 [Lachnospirales bacterium]